MIVKGMVDGSTVHGMGAALLEEFRYDADGQLLTPALGAISGPAAVASAVEDTPAGVGVVIRSLPITPRTSMAPGQLAGRRFRELT